MGPNWSKLGLNLVKAWVQTRVKPGQGMDQTCSKPNMRVFQYKNDDNVYKRILSKLEKTK